MPEAITATIRYVQCDPGRGPSEKPYILHYVAPDGFPQNNFTITPVNGVKVHDLRVATAAGTVSYEENGVKLASLSASPTSNTDTNTDGDGPRRTQNLPVMRPSDFDDDDWVESVYLPALHRCVCAALGARDVTVFDWMVRRRSPSFPVRREGEENVEAHQPSLSAHIDYTTAELESRLDRYFGEDKEAMLGRRYQVVNIWKPLTGPCRDFPMAYLDPQTLDAEKDLIAVDEVFPTVANEVFQVCWNPNHKWYYVPDQLDSEVVIFNAFDSEKGQRLAVPHCSFDLGEKGSGIPRQSIEVRAFVFY